MQDLEAFFLTIGMNQLNREWPLRCKTFQIYQINDIVFLNPVVICLVLKGEGQHTLFLQSGFMDSGTPLHQNSPYTRVTRLHCSMLSCRTSSIVVVTPHYRTYSCGFIGTL